VFFWGRGAAGLERDLISRMSQTSEVVILDEPAIGRALTRIAHEIDERNTESQGVVLIGIQRGGVRLAERLSALLSGLWSHSVAVGSLDINMHRDDLHTQLAPEVHETRIPFDITDKTVVLVDDVLFSGRTVRAALDAMNDFGRPSRVQVAVLVDRGHRELPIRADFVGKNVPTALNERVHVCLREENGSDRVSLIRP
jgi:pyrimidine operon attenuation protein / uracil phosphoribosyltransferase